MKKATSGNQVFKLMEILHQTELSFEDMQYLIERGVLSDFLKAVKKRKTDKIDRDKLRSILNDFFSGQHKTKPTKWREENDIIYFSVTSDGTTGEQWIERLENKGFRIGDYAKSILRSPDFKPTSGVTTEIGVLKGMLWNDNDRTTRNIRVEADKRKLLKPNAEVTCLIREMFSDEEIEAMGLLWIVVMHEPINDSDGDPTPLYALRNGDGRWLNTYYDHPDRRWNSDSGFAFVVPQVDLNT